MINNMDMDKDLSAFGEETPSTGKTSLFFPAAGEKKIKKISWQLTISLLPGTPGF